MKLILIPLFFLIMIGITVQMINLQPISTNYNGDSSINTGGGSSDQQQQITDLNASSVAFNVTLLTGFLVLFTSCIAAGVLAGLNISVFGSTVQLSERAQNLLYNSLFYGGLWGVFSVLATIGINGISLFSLGIWGMFGYLMLSLIYVLGVNNQIQHGLEG